MEVDLIWWAPVSFKSGSVISQDTIQTHNIKQTKTKSFLIKCITYIHFKILRNETYDLSCRFSDSKHWQKWTRIHLLIVTDSHGDISARYNLKGSPQILQMGKQANITLSCATTEQYVRWQREAVTIAVMTGIAANGSCLFSGAPNPLYMFTCDPYTYIYNMSLSVTVEDQLQNIQWRCGPIVGTGNSMFRFLVNGMFN